MEWSRSGHPYLVLMEAGEEGRGKTPRLALNQKTWIRQRAPLGRGGCKACWDLSSTGRWGRRI